MHSVYTICISSPAVSVLCCLSSVKDRADVLQVQALTVCDTIRLSKNEIEVDIMMILVDAPRALPAAMMETLQSVLEPYAHAYVSQSDANEEYTLAELLQKADANDLPALMPLAQEQTKDKRRYEADDIVLYLAGMERKEISALYEKLEEAGLGGVMMAVQTPNNMNWTFEALREELMQEAAYFRKREELVFYLEHADRARLEKDADYRNCMMLAASLMQENDLSEKMLDTALAVVRSLHGVQNS